MHPYLLAKTMTKSSPTCTNLVCRWKLNLIRALVLLLAMMALNTCQAQPVHDFGTWFSLNTQGKFQHFNKETRLRWWFDGHLRYLDDAGGFNQSIIRPGIGYQVNENTNVWLGYGWINTLPASGNPIFNEDRLWQQVLWSKQLGRQKVWSRSRLEQRFLSTGSDTGWRFRQFVKMDRPFHEATPWSFVLWDEIFFDLNETSWGQRGSMGQNRVFVGIGRKMAGAHKPKIEIGYLNQFVRNIGSDDRFNHILSVNWFFTY